MGLFRKIFGKVKEQKADTLQSGFANPRDFLFTIPTVSNEFPQTVAISKKTDLDIYIFDDDWRQSEFLNFAALPLIEVEIQEIRKIWDNASKKVNDQFTAFTNCHVRRTIGEAHLRIGFQELLNALEHPKMGSVKIGENYISDGFSLVTVNSIYYGTLVNNVVTQLCISKWNDNTTIEILKLTKLFNLVFINWYHCQIIRQDD